MKKVLAEMARECDVWGKNVTWRCEAGDSTIRNVVGIGRTADEAIADAKRQYAFPVTIEVIETP